MKFLRKTGQLTGLYECGFCGAETEKNRSNVKRGLTRSCGCATASLRSASLRRHGMSYTPEHNAWCEMKARCLRETHKRYPLYGGRGIEVCSRWLRSFENFYHDMGPRPGAGFSLDRIDNDGNYEPGNCRWASQTTQMRNTRANRRIEIDGVSKTITQWTKIAPVGRGTIRERLNRGWPPRRAVFTPSDYDTSHQLTLDGVTLSFNEWARRTGIPKGTIRTRLARGWSVQRALTRPVQGQRASSSRPST